MPEAPGAVTNSCRQQCRHTCRLSRLRSTYATASVDRNWLSCRPSHTSFCRRSRSARQRLTPWP